MNDYTDLIYLLAAILVFSLLSMQVNRSIFRNNMMQTQSSVEYHAIAHAQNYTDQLQWIRSENELDVFANEFPRTDEVIYDESDNQTLPFLVDIAVTDTILQNSNVINKHVVVSVQSLYLENQHASSVTPTKGIKTEFIKNFNQ